MNQKPLYSNAQFKFVCELLWGGVPVNRAEAEESTYFKSNVQLILDRYPSLDKSFFAEHANSKNICYG